MKTRMTNAQMEARIAELEARLAAGSFGQISFRLNDAGYVGVGGCGKYFTLSPFQIIKLAPEYEKLVEFAKANEAEAQKRFAAWKAKQPAK